MNQTIISGRVSKEISVKGKVGYFTLANERDYPFNKDQNGNKVSNFITCKVLGEKNIQRVQQYLPKGTAIIVTGHYFRDSWKDNNGQYQEFNYVLVEKWEFQVGKATEQAEQEQAAQNTEEVSANQPEPAPEGFINVTSDDSLTDLPFR